MTGDPMTEKQGTKLIDLIEKLINVTIKTNGGGGAVAKTSNNTNASGDETINKILEERLKLTKEYSDNMKLIEDRNKRLLKIESTDVKLEEQKVSYLKKMADLESARATDITTFSASQEKVHKKLIKDLEKEFGLESKKLNNVRRISKAEKKLRDSEKSYYEAHKKEIDKLAEAKIKSDKKEEKRSEKSKERSEKVKESVKSAGKTLKSEGLSMIGWSGGFLDMLLGSVKSLLEQDSIMSKLAANYSLSRKETGLLKENILRASVQTAIIGVKTEDLAKMQSSYTDDLERAVMLGEQGMISLANMGVATGLGAEGAAKMAASMELFGRDAEGSSEGINKLIDMSRKSGMSTSVMTRKLQENLKIANSYTFKDGLAGVEKMTIYSSKFRINMQSIAGFADKISNPEGAITAAANLQVLGGSFAQMADPLTLLNQGINDMEGLTKTYDKMLDGLGKVNKETGEVTIGGYDRLKIKAASEAMGISFDEMMTSVRTKAKRKAIEADFNLNPQIKGDEESKNLIASLGQFKNGKYQVMVGGKAKSIASLSKEDIEKLQPKDQALNVNTIAQNTLGLTDILKNSFNMLLQTMMPEIIKGIQTLSGFVLKGVNWLMDFMGGNGNAQKAKQNVATVGGATAGALLGGAIGQAIIPIPVVGALIGAAAGGLIGGIGARVATAHDGFYNGKTGTFTKLDSKDQVVAMKKGGALNNYGSPMANNLFGSDNIQSPNASFGTEKYNNIHSNIKPNNIYNSASNGYSNTYNKNSTYNGNNASQVNGNMSINLQGTINLVGGGSATKISATELIKDRNFVRELTRIIGNQMNRDSSGGKFSGGLNNNSF